MYKNYGDVNFFDGGLLIEKEEDETTYNILKCSINPDEENSYFYEETTIDINDSWIDKEDVCKFAGIRGYSIDYTETEKILFVIGIIDYYGAENTGGTGEFKKKNEIIDDLSRLISEIETDFYDDNFRESNRNFEIEKYDNYGNKRTMIFDNFSDFIYKLNNDDYFLETGDSIAIISK